MEYDGKEERAEIFEPLAYVRGGANGIKAYIQDLIAHMLRNYSNNALIRAIRITKIITNKSINDRKYVPFDQIKMYGTLLKYKGYNVETVCMDDTCVPTYLLNLLNNPDETDYRKK